MDDTFYLNPNIPVNYESENLKVLIDEIRPNFSPSELKEILPLIKMKQVYFTNVGEEICKCVCLTPEDETVEWLMQRNECGLEKIIGGTYSPVIPGIPEKLKTYKD